AGGIHRQATSTRAEIRLPGSTIRKPRAPSECARFQGPAAILGSLERGDERKSPAPGSDHGAASDAQAARNRTRQALGSLKGVAGRDRGDERAGPEHWAPPGEAALRVDCQQCL